MLREAAEAYTEGKEDRIAPAPQQPEYDVLVVGGGPAGRRNEEGPREINWMCRDILGGRKENSRWNDCRLTSPRRACPKSIRN